MAGQLELVQIGIKLSALGLFVGAFGLLLAGGTGPLGSSFRSALEPALREIRQWTSLSRSELADATVLVAIGLAISAAILEVRFLAGAVAVGLWLARPSIERVTRDEHKLFALTKSFSIDLVIGFYTPIMLALFLLGDLLMGTCLLAVVVALSWPAGGGAIAGRRWRMAPVT